MRLGRRERVVSLPPLRIVEHSLFSGGGAAKFELRLPHHSERRRPVACFCCAGRWPWRPRRDRLGAAMILNLATPKSLLREPLFRLLAINLAIGVTVAALMLGGLLALNPAWLARSDRGRPVAAHGSGAPAVRLCRYFRQRGHGHRHHGDRPWRGPRRQAESRLPCWRQIRRQCLRQAEGLIACIGRGTRAARYEGRVLRRMGHPGRAPQRRGRASLTKPITCGYSIASDAFSVRGRGMCFFITAHWLNSSNLTCVS